MIIPFKNLGQYGIIKDVEPYDLPINAWSDGNNIRVNDGYVEKIKGHESVLGTPTAAPFFVMPVQLSTGIYWIYASGTTIYATEGTTQHNLTSGSYSASIDTKWFGGVLGGIPLMTNYYNTPQMLSPASISNNFEDLSNWPDNHLVKMLKPYKGFLIGLDWVESGAERPYLVRWSTSADPGTVPTSWDYTSTTNNAGRTQLSDLGGHIIDGGELGDSFIIYRESAIHEMRYVGGRFVFNFRKIPGETGIFSERCFASFPGGHVVLTGDDLAVFNGSQTQSAIDAKYRTTLFDELEAATNPKRTFLAHNKRKNEVWVCYPTSTSTYPNKALIWNYRHNTTTFRTIAAAHADYGEISPTSTATWDSDSEAWDDDSTVWNDYTPQPENFGLMLADAANTGLFKADSTDQFNGSSFTATIERTGLNLGDSDQITRLKRIYPKMSGTGPVTVYTGYENSPGEGVTWDSGTSFTPGTDHKVDCRTTGRYLGVKFESIGNTDWKLHGYDAEVVQAGRR